jgi:formate-dependent nitrite reductase membrane component NrfD
MFIAWLCALLMGICYLLHLGKPLRFWRLFFKPHTSWIARGFIFIMLFVGFTAIQLILSYWLPGTVGEVVFKVLAGIMALAQSIYTGFVLSYVRGVRFWNSAIVPILFVTCGMVGGFAIMLLISLAGNYAQIAVLENIIRIALVVYALILAVYLWNATYTDSTARESVTRLVRGNMALIFWIGVILLGIVIPVAISASSYITAEASSALLLTAAVSEIIGGLALRYVVLKAGIYTPLLPVSNS